MPDGVGPVVSNTGPLSALSLLDRLRLLPELYGEVLMPAAVFAELQRGPGADLRRVRLQAEPRIGEWS